MKYFNNNFNDARKASAMEKHRWSSEKSLAAFDGENWIKTLLDPKNPTIIPPKKLTCCICRCSFIGYGNNALPFADDRCCDVCDIKVVQQVRIGIIRSEGGVAWKPDMADRVPKIGKNTPIKVIDDEDIQREIKKIRKEAERKAKEEAEEKARKEMREKKRERSPEASVSAGVSIAQLTAAKGKEDDEAKEIRRRAKEVKVKVKTRPSK